MSDLKIIVCAKQIPDPEAPFSSVTVDTEKRKVEVDAPDVINPFDENALEAALRIKETMGCHITVVSLGASLSDTVLRKAIAAGANELVLIEDPVFEELDSNSTAYALSKAIEQLGDFDLILTGRQAGDWDAGQVGSVLAEILNIPCITMACGIKVEDGHVIVDKTIPGAIEVVKARMPALVTVSNEVGELRYVSRSKLLAMLRKRIPMKKWKADQLNLAPDSLSQVGLSELLTPPDMRRDCVLIEGSSPEEKAAELAKIIKSLI